ncbi:MAG: hypothetical protein ACRBFS_20830 [Aureispira sp.]
MQPILTLLLFVFSWTVAFAQTGSYTYKSKSTGTTIDLELRRDGVFIYDYQKGWASCKTRGNWRPLGSGRVILTSEYQLTDYKVKEIEEAKGEGIQLLVQSAGKNQSPTNISAIYLNEDETASFQPDGEAGLKLLEQRQRQLVVGSEALRDSIKNTDLPRFYLYPNSKKVSSITVVFDDHELLIPIENNKATKIILTTSFAPNSAYKYMKEQEFIKKGDFISEAGSAIKLKKKKR